MTSAVETEVKLRLGDREWENARLWLSGHCDGGERVRQEDHYYAHPCRDFGATDEALRLRFRDGSCVLTYKGPRAERGVVKSREELKVPLDRVSCPSIEAMLERLGFRRVAVVSKVREKYRCPGGLKVALDEVEGLGRFMEVEVEGRRADAVSRINDLLERMGVEGQVVGETYLEMILSRPGGSKARL